MLPPGSLHSRVLALESNQQARPVEGVPGALRVGPAINVDKSLVVHPVALAFVPSKIAVTSVDVCAAGLTGQPDDRLVGRGGACGRFAGLPGLPGPSARNHPPEC